VLARWLRRRRWRRSADFDAAVEDSCEEICNLHGPRALEMARRKYRRRDQPPRRKMVWREVVKRLEARQAAQAVQPHGDGIAGPVTNQSE
jgi:hypothetical protein